MSLAAAPLVDAFARELDKVDTKRKAFSREEYTAAFLRAAPHMVTSPDRQLNLAEALVELEAQGVLARSKRQDGSGPAALPTRVVLLGRTDDPPVGPEVASHPWRPELLFAARLPLRRSEFQALLAIQAFLRDAAPNARRLPMAERSLQLFGDEKRLDALARNRRLFGPGRLSLDTLLTYRCPPPFAYSARASGDIALVVENAATYSSILAALPAESPVGLVVFGGGNGFVATVAYFGELIAQGACVREIRYFGDLDPEGLRIAIGADQVAQDIGLPRVLPAPALWAALLQSGRPAKHAPVSASTAAKLASWLPSDLLPAAVGHLVAGTRLAQEAVSFEVLVHDRAWATLAGLGVSDRVPSQPSGS